jgi:hypothetical protein
MESISKGLISGGSISGGNAAWHTNNQQRLDLSQHYVKES